MKCAVRITWCGVMRFCFLTRLETKSLLLGTMLPVLLTTSACTPRQDGVSLGAQPAEPLDVQCIEGALGEFCDPGSLELLEDRSKTVEGEREFNYRLWHEGVPVIVSIKAAPEGAERIETYSWRFNWGYDGPYQHRHVALTLRELHTHLAESCGITELVDAWPLRCLGEYCDDPVVIEALGKQSP